MSYLSFKYIFASVLVRVFAQNYHGVAWYEDTSTTQNCLCSSNDTNGSNVYYMNRTQKHVQISPVTSNSTFNCSNSKCIDCNWEIHVDYDNHFDVIQISQTDLNDCPDINCANFSLMITNCQAGMIFNYNSSTVNNIQYIDIATQETTLCIYFNSSQFGSVCNYDLFLNYGINFDYISVNDCGSCWQSNELYLNVTNNLLFLPIDYSEDDIICLNGPCVNCTWHINISYDSPNDYIEVSYGQDVQLCNSRLIITNCKNNFPIIDSSSAEILNINQMEYEQDYSNHFNIQENELCITLNTTGSEAKCSYYPTNGNFCWFQLDLYYYSIDGQADIFFEELSMNTELPVLVVPDELKNSDDAFSLISNFGTLQLWLANNIPGNTLNFSEFVFDSHNLSNIVTTYHNTDQLFFINSSTGSFSINPTNIEMQDIGDWSFWFYYVFRITETHFSNCNDTNFINFAFPFATTLILNATANTSGNCLSSILIPYVSPSNPLLPILYISSIKYVGPSTVKAVSTIYNKSYELFEFSEENSTYLEKFVIYGNLINFIIPPNGTLQIEYQAWESAINITEYDFEDYGLGIIQSSNYPRNSSTQNTPKSIKCNKGMAEITIQLIYVEVPVGGYLRIYSQNQSKAYQNGVFTNETIVFNAVEVTLDYSKETAELNSTGLLLQYEGRYINIKKEKLIWQEAWFWILVGIVIFLLFVAAALGVYCYLHRYKKNTSRRFMLSFIKRQNQNEYVNS